MCNSEEESGTHGCGGGNEAMDCFRRRVQDVYAIYVGTYSPFMAVKTDGMYSLYCAANNLDAG